MNKVILHIALGAFALVIITNCSSSDITNRDCDYFEIIARNDYPNTIVYMAKVLNKDLLIIVYIIERNNLTPHKGLKINSIQCLKTKDLLYAPTPGLTCIEIENGDISLCADGIEVMGIYQVIE